MTQLAKRVATVDKIQLCDEGNYLLSLGIFRSR